MEKRREGVEWRVRDLRNINTEEKKKGSSVCKRCAMHNPDNKRKATKQSITHKTHLLLLIYVVDKYANNDVKTTW